MPQPDKGLPKGTLAPDFTLPTAEGGELRLADLRGGWVVLYFLRGTW